jgi:hypothetical protein
MSDPGGLELVLAGLVLIALVALVVLRPLLGSSDGPDSGDDERRAALEAAKEAKYREIRDAELDFRMGKLSEPDYRTTDRELRAQAIEILHELDRLEEDEGGR